MLVLTITGGTWPGKTVQSKILDLSVQKKLLRKFASLLGPKNGSNLQNSLVL